MIRPAAQNFHQKALRSFQKGQEDLAIKQFRQAIKQQSRDQAVWIDFAKVLTLLFRYSEASEILKNGIEAFPEPNFINSALPLLIAARDSASALKVIEDLPDPGGLNLIAADLLERKGDLQEAADFVGRFESRGSTIFESQFLRSKLEFRSGRYAESLAILDQILLKGGRQLSPASLAQVHYARGRDYDRLGEFKRAFEAWSAAKDVLLPLAGKELDQSNEKFAEDSEMITRFSPEILREWQSAERKPAKVLPILLTGFPRSGTTVIEHHLERSLGIKSADENTAFRDLVWRKVFDQVEGTSDALMSLSKLPVGACMRIRSNYEAALLELSRSPVSARRVIDKNPQLMPLVVKFLRFFPRMPIIEVVRDPRDVLLSCYGMDFGLNSHSVHYLNSMTAAERIIGVRGLGMKLRECLGEQMRVIRYEKFVKNPEGEISCLKESLGGETSENTKAEPSSSARVSYSPTYAEVQKPVYASAVERWKHYEKFFEPAFSKLSDELI